MNEFSRVIVSASLPKQASKLLTLGHESQFPCLKLLNLHILFLSELIRLQPNTTLLNVPYRTRVERL